MSTARDELSFDITVTLKTVISLYNHVGIVCDTSVGSFFASQRDVAIACKLSNALRTRAPTT